MSSPPLPDLDQYEQGKLGPAGPAPASIMKPFPQQDVKMNATVVCADPVSPEVRGPMSDTEREQCVSLKLRRYKRNKNAPERLETLRYNLIAARVVSGLTGVEAAERLGYQNSTQLSQIENGERKVPNDWEFLRLASVAYGVSTDFLLGLSPHIEVDGKVAQQHALLRKTEAVMGSVAETFATALIQFTAQDQVTRSDMERIISAAMRLDEVLTRLRDRGFDDFPGGAPLLAAVAGVIDAADPVRGKLRQYQSIEDYLAQMRSGQMPVLTHLTERYDKKAVRGEVL